MGRSTGRYARHGKYMISLLLTLFFFTPSSLATEARYIELQGSINPGSAGFILENISAAEKDSNPLLILRLDTPGGLLSSTKDIIQGISASKVPVVVYVGPSGASATSAGALIGLAAHVLVMAPGTNIGAAHPVGSGGEDVKGAMGEKVTNDTAALARAQAALRGRSTEAAELIVLKSKSYTSEEAVKANAADFVAANNEELLKKLDGRSVKIGEPALDHKIHSKELTLSQKEMNLQQRLLHFIADPNLSAMLMTLGGLAIYAEVSSGFTLLIPGAIGLFCLVLGFISLQTLPVNIGGAILFALGFLMLIAEAYITSYGLLTVAALASLLVGGLFLIDPAAGDMRVSLSILLPIVGGVGLIAAFVGYLMARDAVKLKDPPKDPLLVAPAKIETVESDGKSGTAYVNGELWKFRSKENVKLGETCQVKKIEGMTLHLERRM
jgi:membrane-bound serine protease (ClpP class)